MSKKVFSLLTLVAVSLVATACIRIAGARVGDLQQETQTVELDNASAVDVEIQMGAGELDVSGGASELLEASFIYNVEELNPRATFNNGRLVVEDSGVKIGLVSLADLDEFRNEWDLRLNEDVPLALSIELGAGRSNLTLGDLALTSLDVQGGAGDVTIDLTGDWQNDLDVRISGGLGGLNVRLPGAVGVSIEVDGVIGGVDTSGLTRDGDRYVNDAFGGSGVTLQIDIDGGLGDVNLDVE